MTNFIPTLELVLTPAEVDDIASQGMSIHEAELFLAKTYRDSASVSGTPFVVTRIRVLDGNYFVDNFSTFVSGIFEKSGVTHLKLVTGDVVAIRFVVKG